MRRHVAHSDRAWPRSGFDALQRWAWTRDTISFNTRSPPLAAPLQLEWLSASAFVEFASTASPASLRQSCNRESGLTELKPFDLYKRIRW
jgi:hypothetical protein